MYYLLKLICGIYVLSTLQCVSSLDSGLSQRVAAEGGTIPNGSTGDKTHLSREHVANKTMNTVTLSTNSKLDNTSNINETVGKILTNDKSSSTIKPVTEATGIDLGVPKKNDEKQSVGKKGVSFSDIDTTLNVSKEKSSTEAPLPKKPLITEHDEFVSKTAESGKSDLNSKIPNIGTILEKKSNRADYVIPIVAVILSVPLVAIIISVLYKRGTDWWQHRNYRRMDFLIEGMYNN